LAFQKGKLGGAKHSRDSRCFEAAAECQGEICLLQREEAVHAGRDLRQFGARREGTDFPEPPVLVKDFAAHGSRPGVNTVRTYAVSPCWLRTSLQRGE
jgi:hypothetical protein